MNGIWSSESPNLAFFLGIPYAQPPIGGLRYKPPVRAQCWSGTFNATQFGSACFQSEFSSGDLMQSEDCLTLNVFTSRLNTSVPVPVFLFIHGGGLMGGSSQSYGPIERLVGLSNSSFVLVSINYRLNALGWVAASELSANDPRGVSGNYGLLDQQMAMAWVRENVLAFGGDASRVILVGQSSGGTSIMAHLASPVCARGALFDAAVSLSGSPLITMPRETKEAQDRSLWLDNTPCAPGHGNRSRSDTAVYECLMSTSPGALIAGMDPRYSQWSSVADYPSPAHRNGLGWAVLPFVDGVSVARPLPDALAAGMVDVPVVFQTLQAEMDTGGEPYASFTNASLQSFFNANFLPWGAATGAEVFQRYASYAAASPEYAYYAVDADTASACGQTALAIAAAGGFRSAVYVGEVVAAPSHGVPYGSAFLRWPYHNWDFSSATHTWPGGFTPGADDVAFGAALLSMWSGLASNGSFPASVGWAPVRSVEGFPDHYAHGVIGPRGVVQTVRDLKTSVCDFWRGLGVDNRFWWVN